MAPRSQKVAVLRAAASRRSGVRRAARKARTSSRNARSAGLSRSSMSPALAALEGGRALGQEGRDALGEVFGAAGFALGDALVLQLVGELGVERGPDRLA